MRPGRRAPEGEDLPVVLLDDDGVRGVSTTESVELGGARSPRRRTRELALVAVAVAVVVAVGFMGGEADTQDAGATTDTTRGRPRHQSLEEYKRTSTTTRPRSTTSRPTTTTTVRQLLAGTGPLLPGAPTGTTIGFVDSAGVATIIDLDTGSGCSVKVTNADSWSPWGPRALPTFWVQGNRGVSEVDLACSVTEQADSSYGGWPMAVSGDSVWIADGSGGMLTERSLETREPTGRALDIPTFGQTTLAAVDGGLVVSANGDMTFVDLATNDRTALGAGMPLAGHGRDVVYAACPELQCNVSMRNVDGGAPRVISEIDVMPWEPVAISPDGRFIALTHLEGSRPPNTVLLEVDGGRSLEVDVQHAVFTDDGRWLLGVQRGDVVAIPLDGSTEGTEIDLSSHTVRTLAVLRTP